MHWRKLFAIATLFVALAIRLCGGAEPSPASSSCVVGDLNSMVNYTTSLRVDTGGGGCKVKFAAPTDEPQLTFCWATVSSSGMLAVELKLPLCGSNSYISVDGNSVIVAEDHTQVVNFEDYRVWRIVSCTKSTSNAFFTTFYQIKKVDERKWKYTYLTVKNGNLVPVEVTKDTPDENPACNGSPFTVYLYPTGPENPDPCVPEILKEIRLASVYTTRIGKRQVEESLGRLLRLTIIAGDDKYVVVRRRYANGTFTNDLQTEKHELEKLSLDSLFYYRSYTVADRDGQVNELPDEAAFTLQHALSRQYLTADVTRNFLLNIGGNLTGLTFQDAEQFPDSPMMDYRYFKVYKKQVGSGVKAVHVCSIPFRSCCFLPGRSGSIQLYPIDGENEPRRPTFKDPTNAEFSAFSSMSGVLAGSLRAPTFGVYERRPVVAFGAPEVVFISEYSSGGSQGSGQRRVLSYDSPSNRIMLTTLEQALQSPYRIVRQQWTEPESSAIYVSLRVITGSQPQFTTSGLWVTRSSSSPVRSDSPLNSVDLDDRLFNTKCCLCSQNRNDTKSLFYRKGGNIASLSIAQNGTLILHEIVTPPVPNCLDFALTISTS